MLSQDGQLREQPKLSGNGSGDSSDFHSPVIVSPVHQKNEKRRISSVYGNFIKETGKGNSQHGHLATWPSAAHSRGSIGAEVSGGVPIQGPSVRETGIKGDQSALIWSRATGRISHTSTGVICTCRALPLARLAVKVAIVRGATGNGLGNDGIVLGHC